MEDLHVYGNRIIFALNKTCMNTQTLLSIIADQREELLTNDYSDFCSRPEESRLDLKSNLAQVVIGVRRCGKSTLCEMFLRQKNVEFAYVNFDDDRMQDFTTNDLDCLLEALYMTYGDFKCLFLDEIQNVKAWPLFVNRLLRQKLHIFITGSNSKLLSNELSTHLTGRNNKVELYPFSYSEYCAMKNIDTTSLSTKAKGVRKSILHEYLQQGGFPELFNESNRRGYVNGLLDAIIKNDIAKRFKVRNVEALRRISAYLLDNYCQEFVAKTVGELFGVSNHTAENYYAYLKEAFLLIGIKRFSYKSKDRVRNEKVYVVDTTFVTERDDNFSIDNLGWKLENVVCVELMRRYKPMFCDIFYYRDASSQVDFVIAKDGNVRELIQVSYDISAEKTRNREIRGLKNAAKKLNCNNLTLITFEEQKTIDIEDFTINVIPATEWLLDK